MDSRKKKIIERATKKILYAIGEDARREGLARTPERVARFYDKFLEPLPDLRLTKFSSKGCNQIIVRKGIRFFSLCEHHLLPFFGTVDIAYVPKKYVIGLSKLGDIVEIYSHCLNIQETMGEKIADKIVSVIQPQGVMVVIKGVHTCEMRIRLDEGLFVTSAIRGCFVKEKTRLEALNLFENER